jgi:hypothetical protein
MGRGFRVGWRGGASTAVRPPLHAWPQRSCPFSCRPTATAAFGAVRPPNWRRREIAIGRDIR